MYVKWITKEEALELYPIQKGTRSMNEDTKLECLRLAVDICKDDKNMVMGVAKQFYEWVTSEDKPSSLKIKYEKTLKERE